MMLVFDLAVILPKFWFLAFQLEYMLKLHLYLRRRILETLRLRLEIWLHWHDWH